MIKTQKIIIIVVAIVILKSIFLITNLLAMLSVGGLKNQLSLPINWLPGEVSQSADQDINYQEDKNCGAVQSTHDSDASSIECSICTESFKVGDSLSIFSACRHGFHIGCILPWLAQSQACPNCNQSASDMRLLVLTKPQHNGIPEIIVQGERIFREMIARLGHWGQPLIVYFNGLSQGKKAFYSVMSVLGIVLVTYLAYKWWTSSDSDSAGTDSVNVTSELIELATSYK